MKWVNLISLCLLFGVMVGCKKNDPAVVQDNILEAARQHFTLIQSKAGKRAYAIDSLTGRNRSPNWSRAAVVGRSGHEVVIVPLTNQHRYVLQSNLKPYSLFSSETLQRLYLFRDERGDFKAHVLTMLPDSASSADTFSGLLLIEAWTGEAMASYYVNQQGSVKHLEQPKYSIPQVRIQTVCIYVQGWNYSKDDPEGVHWSYLLGCYDLGDGGSGLGGIPELGQTLPGGGGGGGTRTGDGIQLPTDIPLAVESGNSPIENIKQYLNCFTTGNAANTYSVQVCVSQPIPGTRGTWSVKDPINAAVDKNPVLVGHTFLCLTQSGATHITRNVGFYPSSTVFPGNPSSQGMLNNDEVNDYNISLTVGLSSNQFAAVLSYIQRMENITYNLNYYNCTDFVVDAMKAAGISLPRTYGNWPGGSGLNPGDLGEDIRMMPLSANMVRSSEMSPHLNKGNCP